MKSRDDVDSLLADGEEKNLNISKVYVNIVDSDCEMTTAYLQKVGNFGNCRRNGEISNLKTKTKSKRKTEELCSEGAAQIHSPRRKCGEKEVNIQDSSTLTEQSSCDDNDSELYFFDLTGSKNITTTPKRDGDIHHITHTSKISPPNGLSKRHKHSDVNNIIQSPGISPLNGLSKRHKCDGDIYHSITHGPTLSPLKNVKHKIKSEKKDVSSFIRYLLDYEGAVEILDTNQSSKEASSSSSSCNKTNKKTKNLTEHPKKIHTKYDKLPQKNLKISDGTEAEKHLDIDDLIKTIQEIEYKNEEKIEETEVSITCNSPNSSIITNNTKIINNSDKKYESNDVTEYKSQLLASSNFVREMKKLTNHTEQTGLECFMEENNPTQQIYSSTPLNAKNKSKRNKTSHSKEDKKVSKNPTQIQNKSKNKINETQEQNNSDINETSRHIVSDAETSKEGREKNSATKFLDIEDSQNNSCDGDEYETLKINLNITLPFEVPPLHALARNIGKFTKEQFNEITSLNLPIRKGRFTVVEDNLIKFNWERFQKDHDLIGTPPSAFFKLPKKMACRLNFLKFIAHGLHDRPLNSVFPRFKLIFNKPCDKKQPSLRLFTEEEDEYILKKMEKYGPHHYGIYRDIGKRLNRDAKVIWKRYVLLTGPEEKRKIIKWDIRMCGRVVRYILKYLKFDNVEELRDFEVPNKIYKKVANKMEISIYKLKKEFLETIHPHLFADEDLTADQLKQILITRLYESGVKDSTLVDWKELANHCHGVNHVAIAAIFKRILQGRIKKDSPYYTKSFSEKVAYLYNDLDTISFKSLKIKTWIFKNGQIEKISNKKKSEMAESNLSSNSGDAI